MAEVVVVTILDNVLPVVECFRLKGLYFDFDLRAIHLYFVFFSNSDILVTVPVFVIVEFPVSPGFRLGEG